MHIHLIKKFNQISTHRGCCGLKKEEEIEEHKEKILPLTGSSNHKTNLNDNHQPEMIKEKDAEYLNAKEIILQLDQMNDKIFRVAHILGEELAIKWTTLVSTTKEKAELGPILYRVKKQAVSDDNQPANNDDTFAKIKAIQKLANANQQQQQEEEEEEEEETIININTKQQQPATAVELGTTPQPILQVQEVVKESVQEQTARLNHEQSILDQQEELLKFRHNKKKNFIKKKNYKN